MENEEKRKKVKYYKFGYLFNLIGPKSIFLSKGAWDFWISVIGVVIISVRKDYLSNFSGFAGNWAIISATLLGLIIASYAIIASISDKDLLLPLVKSGMYQYSIFQFTWSSIWLFISLIISLMEVSLNFFWEPIVLLSVFSLLYGISGSFVSIYRALHDLSIMNARKNLELKEAWAFHEDKKKPKDKV